MILIKQLYQDDQFDHLVSDIDKMRVRFRQYISFSGTKAARSIFDEILMNSLDETRSPKSPGNTIKIEFDERDGFVMVEDNGRGIPTNLLEEIYTSLNMGSNIYTSKKANLKAETLGQNGTGTLAICALAELVEITSNRGGTENISRTLVFEEGKKVDDRTGKCPTEKHGMCIRFKPSKVLGKDTRIVWSDIHDELLDLQFLLRKKIKISSLYTDAKGQVTEEKYPIRPFDEILLRNDAETFLGQRHMITVDADNVIEEIDGQNIKRYVSMDLAFGYVNSPAPYIDSFSNSVHTVDAGDHLDAAMEAICRFLQNQVKASMSDKEKEKLDIRWDDVKSGLTMCVALRTNFERMYTGQTKHKVVSAELKRTLIQLITESLGMYFAGKNQSALKELIGIVKMNARARREADKVKSAVVKNALTDWSGYKIKNFDPCTAKGTKEYKELFIIEGDQRVSVSI